MSVVNRRTAVAGAGNRRLGEEDETGDDAYEARDEHRPRPEPQHQEPRDEEGHCAHDERWSAGTARPTSSAL